MDLEVGSPIAVHVTRHDAIGKAQLTGLAMERGLADKSECLIACDVRIRIDAAQIDTIGSAIEILDRIDSGSAGIAQGLENKSICSASAKKYVLPALTKELVSA